VGSAPTSVAVVAYECSSLPRMPQVSVIMGPERRRRWRPEEKPPVLAEVFALGVNWTAPEQFGRAAQAV
jgi:hypothetical protein